MQKSPVREVLLANLNGLSWFIRSAPGLIHKLPGHYGWVIFVSNSSKAITSCKNSLLHNTIK